MANARPATRDDCAAITEAMARAFLDDPFARFAAPDDDTRLGQMQAFFECQFAEVFFDTREVITGPSCEATAVWSAPGNWELTPSQEDRVVAGIAEVFRDRIELLGTALGTIEGKLHPKEPHWYLDFLGTDPRHQGKGLGSAVMAPVLARCDIDGTPAYLWTAKESNLAFYGRHGFEVIWDWVVPEGPPTWGMWRNPR